ncbi:MAG: TadE family protein [Patescibacteria group bacterium]|nr:TadE family protein [Patescibacteria group bacterium]
MTQAVLTACLPWFACLIGLGLAACVLVWRAGCVNPARLRRLHADQRGSAQSLSFVLALPVFIMVLMLIVQVSQLMIGTIVVQYAAFAGARSAVVWIPARLATWERENCVVAYYANPNAPEQHPPTLDPDSPDYGPSEGGMEFLVAPTGLKYEQIRRAAVLAIVPICPSRNVGLGAPSAGRAADVLETAAYALAPGLRDNAVIGQRLRNKLAYAMHATQVEVRFFHDNAEPPLVPYYLGPDQEQFRLNELGWRDQITVTVWHDLALLPGPGRMLARVLRRADGSDPVSERISAANGVYTTRLSAEVTLSNEGEQSVVPHEHAAY